MSHQLKVSVTDLPMRTSGRTYVKPSCTEASATIIPIEDRSGPPPKYLRAYVHLDPNVIVPAHKRGSTRRTLLVLSGEIVVAVHTGTGHQGDWETFTMSKESLPLIVAPDEWLALTTSASKCLLWMHWLQPDIVLPKVTWEHDVEALWGKVSE